MKSKEFDLKGGKVKDYEVEESGNVHIFCDNGNSTIIGCALLSTIAQNKKSKDYKIRQDKNNYYFKQARYNYLDSRLIGWSEEITLPKEIAKSILQNMPAEFKQSLENQINN
jgi:hypothetical protein